MKAVLGKEGPCPLWLAAPPDMALVKASRRGASDVWSADWTKLNGTFTMPPRSLPICREPAREIATNLGAELMRKPTGGGHASRSLRSNSNFPSSSPICMHCKAGGSRCKLMKELVLGSESKPRPLGPSRTVTRTLLVEVKGLRFYLSLGRIFSAGPKATSPRLNLLSKLMQLGSRTIRSWLLLSSLPRVLRIPSARWDGRLPARTNGLQKLCCCFPTWLGSDWRSCFCKLNR